MRTPASFVAKMSETNILQEYSSYLQQTMFSLENQKLNNLARSSAIILSYAEFKEYYISTLIGKDDFLDSIVREYQFSTNSY